MVTKRMSLRDNTYSQRLYGRPKYVTKQIINFDGRIELKIRFFWQDKKTKKRRQSTIVGNSSVNKVKPFVDVLIYNAFYDAYNTWINKHSLGSKPIFQIKLMDYNALYFNSQFTYKRKNMGGKARIEIRLNGRFFEYQQVGILRRNRVIRVLDEVMKTITIQRRNDKLRRINRR